MIAKFLIFLRRWAHHQRIALRMLFAIAALSRRVIPAATPYVEVKYRQALALSTTYQAGIVTWVAFWAFYGSGFGVENLASIGTFGAAYMTVVLIEPLVDLAVLASAKATRLLTQAPIFTYRLHAGA